MTSISIFTRHHEDDLLVNVKSRLTIEQHSSMYPHQPPQHQRSLNISGK